VERAARNRWTVIGHIRITPWQKTGGDKSHADHIKTCVKLAHALSFSVNNYFHKINLQQLLEVTYIIYHNACFEGIIKFVRPPLDTHKPPLQHDINLELMLNRLRSAILQQIVVRNWQFMHIYTLKEIHKICIPIK